MPLTMPDHRPPCPAGAGPTSGPPIGFLRLAARLTGAGRLRAGLLGCGLLRCGLIGFGLLATLGGCGASGPDEPGGPVRLAVLGDSITAGFGLPRDQAFPARVQHQLTAQGWIIEVVNAGRSGDTMADGLTRLQRVIDGAPDVVVVALGGNDGMRGRPPADIEDDLDRIVTRLTERGIDVGIVGVNHPALVRRNGYDDFPGLFRRVAERHGVPLLDDMLHGVVGDPSAMRDLVHPNAVGQQRIADRVARWLLEHDLLRAD